MDHHRVDESMDAKPIIEDAEHVDKPNTPASCFDKYVRWALVFIPTVISLLCLVVIIIFGVVYSRIAEDRIVALKNEISDLISSQRTTYARWGSSSCPDTNGTTLVYSGYVGGNSFLLQGGGSNHLCMPIDPEYTLPFEAAIQGASLIYGAEYESEFLGTGNKNVPCAVCSVTRSQVIMIPAKTSCPANWTREYIGYIMAEKTGNYRTMYICVDAGMESIPGSSDHMEASDLWHTEASCASLPCPPYNSEVELGCVVCSK